MGTPAVLEVPRLPVCSQWLSWPGTWCQKEQNEFYPLICCFLVQEMLMDQTAVTTEGACAEWEPASLVNTWLSIALSPSFSAAKIRHPPPQRAEGFQRSQLQHMESCRLHWHGRSSCWEGDFVVSVTVAPLGGHGCGFTHELLNNLLLHRSLCDFLGNTVTRNWGHPNYLSPFWDSDCYLTCTGEKLPFSLPKSNKPEV